MENCTVNCIAQIHRISPEWARTLSCSNERPACAMPCRFWRKLVEGLDVYSAGRCSCVCGAVLPTQAMDMILRDMRYISQNLSKKPRFCELYAYFTDEETGYAGSASPAGYAG